jgi:hypothetical protein
VSLVRLIPWQYGAVVGMTSYRTVTVCRIRKRGKRKGARGNSGDWTRNDVLRPGLDAKFFAKWTL